MILAQEMITNHLPITLSRVCIIGNGEQSRIVQSYLQQIQPPIVLVGIVLLSGEQYSLDDEQFPPLLGKFDDMGEIVKNNDIQQIIIALDNQDHEALIHIGDECSRIGLRVYLVSDLLDCVAKCILGKNIDLPIFPFSSKVERNPIWETGKRVFDFIFSLSSILFTAPFWLIIALIIKLSSSGPVFYHRKVVGKHGKAFDIYKFRTMYHNNDDTIHKEYMKELITNRSERQTYKIIGDPRITKIGKILRRLSLDELPQFINVLKGEMSVIGPRACTIEEFQFYKEWHKCRTQVKPGISGLWQVKARNNVKYDDMVMLDLYYIQHRSYLLDARLILETIPAMFSGKGAK
jgi:exopolysaccharide biosynthesis polyprenyl glycosylphosphotransferase